MRAADGGQRVLKLEARLGAFGRAARRGAGDERAGAVFAVARAERVVDVDEDDGAGRRRAERGPQARGLRAKLVDERGREDEVVRVGERFGVALATLQAVGEAQAAAELAEVLRAAELEEEGGVVRRRVVVVEARGESVRARGCGDALDEGREIGRASCRERG